MPFWRRRRPIHEELAEGTGLLEWRSKYEPAAPGFRTTLDFLHGARPRRWDAVVTAGAPRLTGEAVHFVALPDGTLLVDETVPDGALEPLAAALERELALPYRAEAAHQGDGVWAVAANSIDVLELPDEVPGDTLELVMRGGERTLHVDGEPSSMPLPAIEAFASERYDDFVARAQRLDGVVWTVQVTAL